MDDTDKNKKDQDETIVEEVPQTVQLADSDQTITEPDLTSTVADDSSVQEKDPESQSATESIEPKISDSLTPPDSLTPDSNSPEELHAQNAGETVGDIAKEEAADEEVEVEVDKELPEELKNDNPDAKWYVVHTYSGHENKVSTQLKQRIESEHLEHKIFEVLVPTQEKIEIRSGKKVEVKEKIFPGYILVKMILDDASWLAVRTTQGVTSFVGAGDKPTPIPDHEVRTIVKFMQQGPTQSFKDIFAVSDTVKIVDGPFTDFIGKVDVVDKEKGKLRILVSIFGRETPVELDFLQVQKL